jgi:ankyrin repeat protein
MNNEMEAWDVDGLLSPLCEASKQGDLSLLVELLDAGADPNAKNRMGFAPLYIASCYQNWTIMIVLLDYGADINARDTSGHHMPLHNAIIFGADSFFVEEELLKRVADIHAKDGNGSTPLHVASGPDTSLAVVELLLGAGADPSAKNTDGFTPLHVACFYNKSLYNHHDVEVRMEVLTALLKRGADIHVATNRGELPIDFALRLMESAPVKCLLQHHYSSLCDGEGRIPLHAILRDATFDGNPVPPLRTALDEEVLDTNDLLEIIKFLVNQNPELVSARDEDGSVPLHVACATSAPLEIARYLVEYAPETLQVARTTDGSYPLHVALEHGASLVVIDLLLHSQDPDTTKLTNNAGETPLHVACRRRASFDGVQNVMNGSGDAVKSETSQGELPLFMACAAAEPSLNTIFILMKEYPDVVKRSSPTS